MTTKAESKTEMPKWQEISGILPERESELSADQRDEGIRKLLREVQRMARAEFARGESAPSGERTVFWDPLERICREIGISRVKLSAFSRELTGMRAHEITDRIKAEKLEAIVTARLKRVMAPMLETLKRTAKRESLGDRQYRQWWALKIWRQVKQTREGPPRMRWAVELGFANPSRLSRACVLAHGMSIDEFEGWIVFRMVQKFFEESFGELPQRTQRTQRTGERVKVKDERPAQDDSAAAAAAIVKEAVEAVMRGKVAVA